METPKYVEFVTPRSFLLTEELLHFVCLSLYMHPHLWMSLGTFLCFSNLNSRLWWWRRELSRDPVNAFSWTAKRRGRQAKERFNTMKKARENVLVVFWRPMSSAARSSLSPENLRPRSEHHSGRQTEEHCSPLLVALFSHSGTNNASISKPWVRISVFKWRTYKHFLQSSPEKEAAIVCVCKRTREWWNFNDDYGKKRFW